MQLNEICNYTYNMGPSNPIVADASCTFKAKHKLVLAFANLSSIEPTIPNIAPIAKVAFTSKEIPGATPEHQPIDQSSVLEANIMELHWQVLTALCHARATITVMGFD